MTFRVGQEVVYVYKGQLIPGRRGYGDELRPVYQKTYTVRGIPDYCHVPCLLLEEVVNAPRLYCCADGISRFVEIAYSQTSFRPVVKTDISIFQAMLAPSPKKRVAA